MRVLSCPNCGGTVALRAAGLSVSAVCASCGSTIDVADESLKVIAGAQARTKEPLIPIGARATLAGCEWEAIGWQRRRDPDQGMAWDDSEAWDEYLLFNPYEGFRFLASDDEEWTLYAMLRQDVPDPESGASDGRRYSLSSTGRARTEYVLGEFYWRVKVGDEVKIAEYVSEPHVLSREEGADEVVWSRGVRIASHVVTQAFRLPEAAAPPTASEKAAASRASSRRVRRVFWIALAVLAIAEVAPFGQDRDARVFAAQLPIVQTDPSHPLATEPFAVPDAGGSLQIAAASPVRNSWVSLGVSLVNQADSRSYDALIAIEAYEGIDSDGAWSEGSEGGEATFPRVPGGTYRLLIDLDAQRLHRAPRDAAANGASDPATFSVEVRRHVHSSWNIALALLALSPYPVWRWLVDRTLPPSPRA